MIMWSQLGFPLTHDDRFEVIVGRTVEEQDGGFTGKTYHSIIFSGILAWFAYHRMLGREDPRPINQRRKQRYWLFLFGYTAYELLFTFIRSKRPAGSGVPFLLDIGLIIGLYFCLFFIYDTLLPGAKKDREP